MLECVNNGTLGQATRPVNDSHADSCSFDLGHEVDLRQWPMAVAFLAHHQPPHLNHSGCDAEAHGMKFGTFTSSEAEDDFTP